MIKVLCFDFSSHLLCHVFISTFHVIAFDSSTSKNMFRDNIYLVSCISILYVTWFENKKVAMLKIQDGGQMVHLNVFISHFRCRVCIRPQSKLLHLILWHRKCIFRHQNHVYTLFRTWDIASFRKKRSPFWKSNMAAIGCLKKMATLVFGFSRFSAFQKCIVFLISKKIQRNYFLEHSELD